MASYNEKPFFFNSGDYRLFGVLHQPMDQIRSAEGRSAVLICSPFAEEKLFSHRVLVNLARSLACSGYFSMRFDYMGHGDSDGSFEDSTVETRVSDIRFAIRYLKEQIGIHKIYLLGLRLGACLAAMAAVNHSDIDSLILMSPIVSGKKYAGNLLRSNLSAQLAAHKKIVKDRQSLLNDLRSGYYVNIDGYRLSPALFDQIEQIDLNEISFSHLKNILCIDIHPNPNRPPSKELTDLLSTLSDHTRECELRRVEEQLFWTELKTYLPYSRTLETTVISWLEKLDKGK